MIRTARSRTVALSSLLAAALTASSVVSAGVPAMARSGHATVSTVTTGDPTDVTPPAPVPTGTTSRRAKSAPRFLPQDRSGLSFTGTATPLAACSGLAFGVRPDTTLVAYSYQEGRSRVVATRKVGWVPRTMAFTLDIATGDSVFWAIHPDGSLRQITLIGDDLRHMRMTQRVVARNWGNVRTLSIGGLRFVGNQLERHLYAVSTTGEMRRFAITANGRSLRYAGTVSTRGWWGVNTLTFDRVEFSQDRTEAWDVLVATTSRGELREYFISQSRPSYWARATLRAKTWQSFAMVTTGFCDTDAPSRPILAVKRDGSMFAYVDQDATDRSGADISGGVRSGLWTGRIYPF